MFLSLVTPNKITSKLSLLFSSLQVVSFVLFSLSLSHFARLRSICRQRGSQAHACSQCAQVSIDTFCWLSLFFLSLSLVSIILLLASPSWILPIESSSFQFAGGVNWTSLYLFGRIVHVFLSPHHHQLVQFISIIAMCVDVLRNKIERNIEKGKLSCSKSGSSSFVLFVGPVTFLTVQLFWYITRWESVD